MTRSPSSLLCEARTEARIDDPTPRQTARTEIDRHVMRDGRNVSCGMPFPCSRAVLAVGLF